MSTKKDTKINNKKNSIGTMPINQRSPSSKQCDSAVKIAAVANSTGLKEANSVKKNDTNSPMLATNKLSPAKTSRNQVSANWNSVAGSLKSHRTIPSTKKIGMNSHRSSNESLSSVNLTNFRVVLFLSISL